MSPQLLPSDSAICAGVGRLTFIDVRTPVEFRELHAADARNVPLDQLDPAAIIQARNGSDEPLYVICRSGGRGRQACEKFLAAGFTNVVNVEGGTLAWAECGLPVVRGKKTISLERQVRIAAGSLVLLGLCSAGSFTPHSSVCPLSSVPDSFSLGSPTHAAWACCWPGCPGTKSGMAQPSAVREGGLLMKLLIVGGVAGGASAAARARRLSEDAHIVLFERGPDVSFANCGLPYYIGGEIAERDKLFVATPERLKTRFKLDVRTRTSVEAIDRAAKKVRVRDLAPGENTKKPTTSSSSRRGRHRCVRRIPGIDLAGIFTLRNLQDVDRIKAAIDRGREASGRRGRRLYRPGTGRKLRPPRHCHHGRRIAGPGAAAVRQGDDDAHRRGIGEPGRRRCCSANPPRRSSRGRTVSSVRLKSGQRLPAQLVVFGVGVRPENKLAVDAGPGSRASWRHPGQRASANRATRTSTPSGTPSRSRTSSPANRRRCRWRGRPTARAASPPITSSAATSATVEPRARPSCGVFDRTAAMTGASEKVLRRANRPYRKVYIHPTHHAGYYPGAEAMTLKMLFDPRVGPGAGCPGRGWSGSGQADRRAGRGDPGGPDGFRSGRNGTRLLSAVRLGQRPDQHGRTCGERDAAGRTSAGGCRNGPGRSCRERPFLVDVRTPQEFAPGHIPGAVNIPVDDLRSRLAELPRDREIAVYCQVGQRGYLATRILLQAGF